MTPRCPAAEAVLSVCSGARSPVCVEFLRLQMPWLQREAGAVMTAFEMHLLAGVLL